MPGAVVTAARAGISAYQYVVIGGGSGGIASARRAAQAGARVALIERARLGGTCVNVGCVPKKVMWHAAEIMGSISAARHYGIHVEGAATVDLAKLKAARDAYVLRLNGIYRDNALSNGIDVFEGDARFAGPGRVLIRHADASESEVTSPHVLIATGGAPTIPRIPGAELAITSDSFFDLQSIPRRVAIIGGGYIAVELAGILHSLGAAATMFVRGSARDGVLRGFEDAVRESLRAHMTADGIVIVDDADVQRIDARGDAGATPAARELTLTTGDSVQHGPFDVVLFATGRAPSTGSLNLNAAGDVQLDAHGHIVVDAWQNTDTPGLYAVGDVCVVRDGDGRIAPRWHLTPVAIAAGRLLADRLFRALRVRLHYSDVPSVVFSHPPIGTVGDTVAQACARYGDARVKVFRSTYTPLSYGVVPARADGTKPKTVMILVCVRDEVPSGVHAAVGGETPFVGLENASLRVVGLHVHGEGADEMMQAFAIAVKMRATKADFDAAVAIHPTAAEEFVTMPTWFPHLEEDGGGVPAVAASGTA